MRDGGGIKSDGDTWWQYCFNRFRHDIPVRSMDRALPSFAALRASHRFTVVLGSALAATCVLVALLLVLTVDLHNFMLWIIGGMLLCLTVLGGVLISVGYLARAALENTLKMVGGNSLDATMPTVADLKSRGANFVQLPGWARNARGWSACKFLQIIELDGKRLHVHAFGNRMEAEPAHDEGDAAPG
jgi:hypothetical protein